MKPLITLIIFSCLITKSSAQTWSQYEDTKGLYKLNKVKEIKIYGYNDESHDSILTSIIRYDTVGGIVSSSFFSIDNKILVFDTLIYNLNHNLIKRIGYYKGSFSGYDTLIYNSDNLLVAKLEFIGENLELSTSYQYNKAGKKIKSDSYKNDTLMLRVFLAYDSLNRISQVIYLSNYGLGYDTVIFNNTYNLNGMISKRIVTSLSNDITTVYKYNKLNQLSYEPSDESGNPRFIIYKYDSRGNMIELSAVNFNEKKMKETVTSTWSYYSNNLVFEKKYSTNDKKYWSARNAYTFY